MNTLTATYSPDDNKLRLYSLYRLDAETYARVKAAGLKWAPKQELFVAPMWTPGREDLLIELCGEIGDEDTTLLDRAEGRAERFEGYSERRADDADRARRAVAAIADNIPLGQPILVGHHSEKRARKDAQRIQDGMRKAVKMWETSGYWKARAAGAIHHAKYKELPRVRANRIKTIEAEKRKRERTLADAEKFLTLWRADGLTFERAKAIANYCHISRCFPLAEFPREQPASQYEGPMGLWSALDGGVINHEQARSIAVPAHERTIAHCRRWIAHLENRLTYERAMLEEQGATELLAPKPRKELLPLLNYRAPGGAITLPNPYHRGETITYPQVEMTKAEYAAINRDYKSVRENGGTHRVRLAMRAHKLVSVFLTDSKEHPIPTAAPAEQPATEPTGWERAPEQVAAREREPDTAEDIAFRAMREQLKHGVQIIAVPQLFATSNALAIRMVEKADIKPGHRVLEPSAGTGAILAAMPNVRPNGYVVAVELNRHLAEKLHEIADETHCADFLQCNGDLGAFDRILMNPPFANAADIKHIQHAAAMLAPGGRLVAICANGPRQIEKLKPLCSEWYELPEGTFKDAGTNVRTALIVIDR